MRTLALRIHDLSGWRWGPFVAVDCGGADSVLEHQLFSVLEADASPRMADGGPGLRPLQAGTLFLHEVGRLSPAHQARLRHLLARAGGDTWLRRLRRRIMASSSEGLLARVEKGTFDDRLFYRLNVMHFQLPGNGAVGA